MNNNCQTNSCNITDNYNCCETSCYSNNNSGCGCTWIWIIVLIILVLCFCNN